MPDLFGDWTVLSEWGRRGSPLRGAVKQQSCPASILSSLCASCIPCLRSALAARPASPARLMPISVSPPHQRGQSRWLRGRSASVNVLPFTIAMPGAHLWRQLRASAGRGQPIQLHRASPITRSSSRPLSHGNSSVNRVTHCRQEQGIRVMSVPQNVPTASYRDDASAASARIASDEGGPASRQQPLSAGRSVTQRAGNQHWCFPFA
jgi:hypothetical protein